MKGIFKYTGMMICAFSLSGCTWLFGPPPENGPSPAELLAGVLGGGPGSPIVDVFAPGAPIDMDGNGRPDGLVMDADQDGTADGIDVDGNGVAELVLLDVNADGTPDGIDQNGDGTMDYYFCATGTGIALRTAPDCAGSRVQLVDGDANGTPDGMDTDGDGVIDDSLLSQIHADGIAPTISVNIAAGTYGVPQSVVISCADNLAPGSIAWTLDGSAPSFTAGAGNTLATPPSTEVSVGVADGTYNLRYICRDAAGNVSPAGATTYVIDSNVPAVSVQSKSSDFVSANSGAIASSNVTWRSNRSGTYTVRGGASDCSSGTVFAGPAAVTADVDVITAVDAASRFAGEGTASFLICVVDGGSSLTGSGTFTLTRDDTAPALTLAPGTGSYSTAGNVSAVCSDASAGCAQIAYTANIGSAPANPAITGSTGAITNGGAYSSALTPADDSVNYYKFIARDNAGNVSAVVSQTVTIATGVANITVNSYTASTASGSVSFNWRSNRPGDYTLRVGGSDCATGSPATGTNVSGTAVANTDIASTLNNGLFAEGANTVRICVENLLSNFGSTTRTVTKDTAAPAVTIAAPAGAGPHVAGTTLSLTCSDTGGTGCLRMAYTTDGGTPTFSGAGCTVTNGMTYAGTPILPNGSYTIKAAACDNAGNVSAAASHVVSVGPPSAPGSASAGPGNAQVSVSFGTVAGATGYRVYYRTDSAVTTSDNFVAGIGSPIVVSGLTNSTTYYFAVTAVHSGGESGLSGVVSATPTPIVAVNETDTTAEADYCNLQFPTSISVSAGAGTIVYGRLYEAGTTEAAGAAPGWTAQLGYGPAGSNPITDSGWTYIDAVFNAQYGNDDEYKATLVAPSTAGTYRYVFRFSPDGTNYTYCDLNGAGVGGSLTFEPAQLGTLTVNP